MDRLTIAKLGYEGLSHAIEHSLTEETSDRAEAWLRDEVCPVVQELIGLSSFKQAALWPHEHLAAGSPKIERQHVEAVDQALVKLAAALRDAISEGGLHSPESSATMYARELAASSQPVAGNKRRVLDHQILTQIADRPWFDLVHSGDYFTASANLMLLKSSDRDTLAFQEQFQLCVPLGDYVTRCALARIEYWSELLERTAATVLGSGCPRGCVNRIFLALGPLEQSVKCLRAACLVAPDARLRESCITLLQVYAAYSPNPVLDWFESPQDLSTYGAIIRTYIRRRGSVRVFDPMRLMIVSQRVADLCDPAILRGVAAALEDVEGFYGRSDDPEEIIARAIDEVDLVMVDRLPREVFWRRRVLDTIDWDQQKAQWHFLWQIAAKAGQPVEKENLQEGDAKNSAKDRRGRLSKVLPPELDKLIVVVRGAGYRLDLTPSKVTLLQSDGIGKLVLTKVTRRAI